MAPTRRTLLKTIGVAAVAGKLLGPREAEAAAAQTSPRSLTLCNLRGSGLGVKMGDRILDVAKAAKNVPASTDEVIAGKNLAGLQKALAAKGPFIAEKDAQFAPCLLAPQKIIMLGFNYRKHAIEVGVPIPKAPVLFNKYNNALNWHGGVINLPQKVAKKFDYEVELVVVMGKTARDVPKESALDYVFGYCTGNDFSARDLQFKTTQLMLGKTSDGFGPLGPWLVTADQVPDVQNLKLQTTVNGELRQNSNTNDMIFDVKTIVSYASQHWTLKPGDIFFTGTPEGVILGHPKEKQVWLKPGDKVACSVEKLGELRFDLE